MIRATDVSYAIGEFALDLSLDVAGGEYFVLLGATGSGKTLLLECLCGLRDASHGRIEVDGVDVTAVEPRDRRIGYVPQDGALFGHLTVGGNIQFGPRVRAVPAEQRAKHVLRLAEMLHIPHLLGRPIPGLSGGERQRVALARALACEPSVLLLDEPVSALDEFTRDAVCRELMRLQRETGVTVVHVCHSFEEARLVADRVGIIDAGRLVQTGTPDELMTRPAGRYVARLLRLENVFTGVATPADGGSQIAVGGVTVAGPEAEGAVEFLVRPWDVRLAKPSDAHPVEGEIVEFSLAGPMARMKLAGPLPLLVMIPREHVPTGLGKGDAVQVAFGRDAVHVFQDERSSLRE